jgi:N-acetyl-S-(2-succino)cysteine monooxygenase
VQAGSSNDGQDLAAASAEVVFTAQQTVEDARAFYTSLKSRLPAYGRTADDLKIMPGISPFVARSQQEAQEKFEQLQSLIDPVLGLGLLSAFLGNVDLSGYHINDPFPQNLPVTEGWKSRQELFAKLAARENLSIRQLYERVASARGHWTLVGTPETIADQLEHWFKTGAADGFNVLAPTLPHGLKDFADLVIPELQRRGLFRTEYTGRTLRDHLGLRRPVHPAARVILRLSTAR